MYGVINSFVILGQNYRSSRPEPFLQKSHFENFLKIFRKPVVAESFFKELQAFSLQLHRTKEGIPNGSFLVHFTNFFKMAFQQNPLDGYF